MSFNHRTIFARTGLSVAVAMSVMSSAAAAEEEVNKLGEVVVTAARTAQTVDETLAPVTVISREQIERSQAISVTELLTQAPGVQIAYTGGVGSKTGVYLRGTKTQQTLILVDGHRMNGAYAGEAPLQYLDPDQIERIEIVRGPRSTLYGADAVGGVINIITRKGGKEPQLTVKAGGGSRNTGEYGLNFNGSVGRTQFNVGARLFETQGYDRTTNQLGSDWDDDAFRNKSISSSLSHRFENGIDAGVNISHSQGKAEYDNSFGSSAPEYPISFFEQTTFNVYASLPVNELWNTKIDAGYVQDDRKDVGARPSYAEGEILSLSWQNDIAWTDEQLLIAGVDYSNDKVTTSNNYAVDERYNVGVFALNQSSFSGSDLQVGGRFDKNEVYGNNTTGSVSWGFDLPADTRLIASYGTAFRAPPFIDLYSPYGPNPDLKPEEARNAELELRGVWSHNTQWSVSMYQNDMDNMLDYNSVTRRTENISKARMRGVEFVVTSRIFDWDLNTNLSFVDPENRSGANAGKTLHRRANQLFTMNVDRNFGKLAVGGTLRAQGKTWDDAANTLEMPGFGTFDLRASLAFTPELKTQLKVVNLLDKDYTTTNGYIDEPRGVFATLIWSPEL